MYLAVQSLIPPQKHILLISNHNTNLLTERKTTLMESTAGAAREMKSDSLSHRLAFILFCFFLSFAAWARAAEPAPRKTFTENYFCMHVHEKPDYEAAFSEIPFKIFRTWDSGAVWPLIEPEKGKWNWELLDSYVRLANANGVKLIFTLGMTPRWAAKNPEAPSPYPYGSSSPPANLNDWREFVRKIAERNEKEYGGAIKYWEIWNEPDNFQKGYEFYTGTVGELVEMARSAREILKKVNPENKIVSPGVTQMGQLWLDKFLGKGGKDLVDVIGIHFYWDWYTAGLSDFTNSIDGLKKVMADNGCSGKPLWVTETGFNINHYKTAGERDMALALTVIAPLYGGADVACAYAWNNSVFTKMYDVESGKQTSLAAAYRELHRWLDGASITGLSRGKGKSVVFALERNGKSARLVWRSAHGETDFEIEKSRGALIFRLDGTASPIPENGIIRLGNSPLLISDEDFF
jgi:hypothetical protein